MADVQALKAKISSACVLLRSNEASIEGLRQAFEFPQEKTQCQEFIRNKTADLNYLTRGISQGKELLEKYIEDAIERIDRRTEQKDQEKLMIDLNKHLEEDANRLEILTIQWLNKIEFRLEELTQQAILISDAASNTSYHANRSDDNGMQNQESHLSTRIDHGMRIRRPLLEVPTFSGNFREFTAFWSVYQSLIHDDSNLSNQEKFLFLKQALKGKAAASISSIPITGEKYFVAVNILKKQYDRSGSMADILISEIERIPRANDNPRSCRETLSAITARITHLEQTGMSLNADRVWRRLILSKFTEHICSTVIRKESDANIAFEVQEIVDTIDDIITLQETTELTTRTLFGTENRGSTKLTRPYTNTRQPKHVASCRPCLCGGSHPPQYCDEFPTPGLRRMEARRQEVCWKCFCRSHKSKFCTSFGKCPKCNEDHHSSLCIEASGTKGANQAGRRLSQQQGSTFSGPAAFSRQHTDRFEMQLERRSHQSCDNGEVQTLSTSASQSPLLGQFVLQTASALIFNEAESTYESVSMLLDSGAQRSFIKARFARILGLQSKSTNSFTTTGMGELQESFSSNEVHVTLRSIHGSAKLYRLPVFTKDKLTVTTKSAELSREDMSFIKKEKITVAQQGLYSRELSPDILIGQDLLNTIIDHEAPTIRLPSGLLLTPTIFGRTISGTSAKNTPSSRRNFALCSSLIITSLSSSSEENFKEDVRCVPEVEPRKAMREHETAEHSTCKSSGRCRRNGIAKQEEEDDSSPATSNLPQRYVWVPSKTAVRASNEPSSRRAVNRTLSEAEKVTKKVWLSRRNEYHMKLRNCHKRAKKSTTTSTESLISSAESPSTPETKTRTEVKPRPRRTPRPQPLSSSALSTMRTSRFDRFNVQCRRPNILPQKSLQKIAFY
ncbi:hypothetical protein Q1695_013402 [Nippostrongylus brasiliensis]|nr:hypothetical protein Q1695_013402 [Nippostrongylus brasiliensis]